MSTPTEQPLPPPPPVGGAVVPPPPSTGEPPMTAADLAARAARRIAGKVPISDITIIVGRTNAEGQRSEEMTNVDRRDYRITGFSQVISEKMQKVKDDEGRLMGHEPTGEHEITIKIRYVVE